MHAERYGQQAGGKHPTGMHSCSFNCLQVKTSNFMMKDCLASKWLNNFLQSSEKIHNRQYKGLLIVIVIGKVNGTHKANLLE